MKHFIFSILFFCTSFLFGQKDLIPVNQKVKTGKLANGLTYYVQQNSKPENKVELRLVIKAGSILEDEDQRGLAHFMEHMNFNGTKNFKKNELVNYLQSIGVKFGAHLNAYTGFDETVYILPIPSDDSKKLEKGFQILEDWAQGALLTEKDINEERGIILEEERSRNGAGLRMLKQYLDKVAYKSKYAKRLPIGTVENIKNFKPESIRRFYKDWYRPDLMAVVAVGDVDVTTLEKKVIAHFSNLTMPKNPKKRKDFGAENHKETFVAIVADKETAVSKVKIVYKDTEKAKKTKTVADFRNNTIEGLFSTILNARLKELKNSAKPPFLFGYSYYGSVLVKGQNAYQSIAVTTKDGQLKALKAILIENERVKRFGFTQSELERAKTILLARYEKAFKNRDKESSSSIVEEYVNNFTDEEPIPGIEWELKMQKVILPSIKLKEVNNLINKYLHKDNRLIIIEGQEKKLTEKQVLDLLKSVENEKIEAYKDKVVAKSLITKKIKPGSVVKTTKNDVLGTTTFELNNGLKVTFKKTDFENNQILFEAFSYGGSSLYSMKELQNKNVCMGMTRTGLNGFSRNDLAKMLSGKMVDVKPYIGDFSEGFSGTATPKDFETLFQLVHLYFTSLNKDEQIFKANLEQNKKLFANIMANPNFYFMDKMGKFMNQNDKRYLGFPSIEDFNKADYNLAYKKFQERFADASDFHFYFVGNVDEAKLKEFSCKYLASLPSTYSKEKYIVHEGRPLSGSHKKIFVKGTAEKSKVEINYQGPAKYTKKSALAFAILGETVNIKLIEKLREKEAGVYSSRTSGHIEKFPYSWYGLHIKFPCAPENVEKLVKISTDEVANVVKNGCSAKDLEKAKKAMILQHKESLKKNDFWMETIKNVDYIGNDADDYKTFEKRVNSITIDDVKKVAQKYLKNGYILCVLNPEKKK